MRACFFARVRDKAELDFVEWYKNDIRILEELGFQVVRATNFHEVPMGCDLYYSWWWHSCLLAMSKSILSGRPNIVTGTVHMNDPGPHGVRRARLVKKVAMILGLRLATVSLATAQNELDAIRHLGAREPRLLYLGIRTERYCPDPLVERKPFIFTLSHLTKNAIIRKRIRESVAAMPFILRRFPQLQFLIAGTPGPGFEMLEVLVDELNLWDNVRFLGRISEEEKISCYRRAMVYVQPSLFEGFGVAIAEAMACGTPVIVSPGGAVPEVVGECGIYTTAEDPQELAEQVCSLIEDPARVQMLGMKGRQRIVGHFSYEKRKTGMREVIKCVMGDEKPLAT